MAFTLVSHALCPYVQRVAVTLHEKGVPFSRRVVDLADKPAWFTAISPLGKTPVLLVDDTALFESAVICEFLEDTLMPRLHPSDPLARARHRAWIAFASAVLDAIAAAYNAPDAASFGERWRTLRSRFEQLEAALCAAGPYFAGADFSLVDAAFAPVFRYLDGFEALGEEPLAAGLPRVQRWRGHLAARDSVRDAAVADYPSRLQAFLLARGSELSRRIASRRDQRGSSASVK